jgi:O-antigen/teichoic acid export membrane protein
MRIANPKSSSLFGPLVRKAAGLSSMTAVGQMTFVIALPLLARLFTPADFGLFTVYLSIVNICGPIAGMKFDSALYQAPSREHARPILALAIFTIGLVALGAAALLGVFGAHLPGALAPASAALGLLTPAGVLLAGLWSTTSAWAVRCNAISTLAIARFLQPATMTVMQVAAGLAGHSAVSLIAAHLLSHTLYSGYILLRTLHASEVREVFLPQVSQLVSQAGKNRMFPMFVMPANVASQLVSNAPPILLGSLFGAEVAGQYGMAYRLIFAPIAIVSLSLGHVFTSEVCSGAKTRAVKALASKIFLVSLGLVCAPILLAGALAPSFAAPLLGAKWAATGQIAFALSILASAQALATPFVEITSIYRFQMLRFEVELQTGALVFAAIFIGANMQMSALATIWLMSTAGAAGTLIGLALVWSAFRRKLTNLDSEPAVITPSAATS